MKKLNGWLTFAGNIAILLGLIALAIEIRHNTSAVRAQELGDLQSQTQERREMMLTSDLPKIYMKSLYSPSELTIEEIYRMNGLVNYRIDHLMRAYRTYQDGILTAEDWESQVRNVPVYLDSAIGRLTWDQLKEDYALYPEFVAAVDGALQEGILVPDHEYYLELQKKIRALPTETLSP